MAPFWNGKADLATEVSRLSAEVASLRTRVVEAERVASECATEAFKRMKRTEQAERRALAAAESANQGSGARGDDAATTPLVPSLTGVRARIAARRGGHHNGIHS